MTLKLFCRPFRNFITSGAELKVPVVGLSIVSEYKVGLLFRKSEKPYPDIPRDRGERLAVGRNLLKVNGVSTQNTCILEAVATGFALPCNENLGAHRKERARLILAFLNSSSSADIDYDRMDLRREFGALSV